MWIDASGRTVTWWTVLRSAVAGIIQGVAYVGIPAWAVLTFWREDAERLVAQLSAWLGFAA